MHSKPPRPHLKLRQLYNLRAIDEAYGTVPFELEFEFVSSCNVIPDPEIRSQGQRLQDFYRSARSSHPLGCRRFDAEWPLSSVVAVAFARGFIVTATQGNDSLFGPHAAKLWYASHSSPPGTPHFWIATAQVEGNFMLDEEIQRSVLTCNRCKEWFIPDSDLTNPIPE